MRLDIALTLQRPGFTLELDQTLELTGITAVMGASGICRVQTNLML